ncbi:multimeric flavodoxin WrbA [Rhodococcus sp. 27YEA15]|uniref:flavodoxin family protein n=1 Tax=Rhodococcus sp. 27YEA15 TaxID=3156259 RepID=UPI003C7E5E99
MKTLLVVHHSPSPATHELLDAVLAGARDPEIEGVDVRVVPALAATVPDVLGADGYLFGTPANFGYMSGALKYFFDTTYYQVLGAVVSRPYGLWVHGNNDTTGAVKSIQGIVTGLGLSAVSKPVEVSGRVDKLVRESCYELGATVAFNTGATTLSY